MNFCLDENAIFPCFTHVLQDATLLGSFIEVMERILHSSVLNLHVVDDFYSLEFEGSNVVEVMYEHQEDGEVRDLLRRLEYIVSQAGVLGAANGGETSTQAFMTAAGKGGLVTSLDMRPAVWWDHERMYTVCGIEELTKAVRKYYVSEKIGEELFPDYSEIMFDSLYFHDPAEKIKDLGVRFVAEIGTVVNHLGYLNDHVLVDFEGSETDREVTIKAGSKGVDISPEGNNTRRDRTAMKLREVIVFDQSIVCEWHTKIKPTVGRIHFYPWACNHPVLAKKIGRKVIVGIMCRHL